MPSKFGKNFQKYYILIVLILNTSFSKCENLSLDLSDLDSYLTNGQINKTTYIIQNFPCTKISPTPNNRIIEIKESKTKIWSSQNSECTGIIVYPESGPRKLIHIFITEGSQAIHHYYNKVGDSWHKINEIEYSSTMETLNPDYVGPTKKNMKKKKGSSSLPSLISILLIPAIFQFYTYP